ncbi:MAG: Rne/Rng family ribonuclease [Pseudolabrys sp.]
MANKMLIDATHPEETRVVVLRGNRVEEFDFESANRKQLRGNIYLAKVTRVEPSLQAAFVDYGGNRHGFLAFSEIHPDYYQIPVADRQALIDAEREAQQDADEEADDRASRRRHRRHRERRSDRNRDARRSDPIASETANEVTGDDHAAEPAEAAAGTETPAYPEAAEYAPDTAEIPSSDHSVEAAAGEPSAEEATRAEEPAALTETASDEAPLAATEPLVNGDVSSHDDSHLDSHGETTAETAAAGGDEDDDGEESGETAEAAAEEVVESVGGADALEEVRERVPRMRRTYKIQEVIKRRQVMLVQVVKEERGNKGAALTTYLSLAGRYSVLMPNTPRGGGISRKITSAEDRNRLKEIAQDLEVPEGMGVILRTAGAARTKLEVKRDFEYLLRLWEQVRDLTLKSTAPTLVYEEGSLTKRSIRDLYNKDVDEIIVAGEQGYTEAKEFMRMLMPSHAKNVKQYRDNLPVFTRYGIESQLDAMFTPTVQLRSGGYIVINQAEALVAIDVNSGRATREHHIEDTALKTNSEAAEEIARQLRLRDLAGLIVIDFIDMDEGRNNRSVERKLKECLKHDRARIQVGRISHFGLLEMSRQRIRTSVLESSTDKCPVCGGSGHVRSVSSVALALLRAVEEQLMKGATHNLVVRTRSEVALYVLNHKRAHLRGLEERFRITITILADASVSSAQSYVIDRGELVHTPDAARAIAAQAGASAPAVEEDDSDADIVDELAATDDEAMAEVAEAEAGDAEAEGERDGSRRRRRRRRGGRGRGGDRGERERGDQGESQQFAHETVAEHTVEQEDHDGGSPAEDQDDEAGQDGATAEADGRGDRGDGRRRRRRGRRGGRRNRHRDGAPRGEHRDEAAEGGDAFADGNGGGGPAWSGPSDDQPRETEPAVAAPREPAPDTMQGETPAAAAEAAAPSATETPRRRSTIREPAGFVPDASPAASPSGPVVSSTSNEEAAQPKRGWWGRRLMGGKD